MITHRFLYTGAIVLNVTRFIYFDNKVFWKQMKNLNNIN